jgi:hypothetical protein
VAGYGILARWYNDDLTLRRNRVRRVGKYSIGLKAGRDGTVGLIQRATVMGNEVTQAGSVGIFAAGLNNSSIFGNLVDSTHRPRSPAASYDTFGFSARGLVLHTRIAANRIQNSAGIGISWRARGAGNTLLLNTVRGSCRQKNPTVCDPGPGGEPHCYDYADVDVWGGAVGDIRLEQNAVEDSLCAAALGVAQETALVHGGRYAGGPHAPVAARFASVSVVVQGAAAFESAPSGQCLEFATTVNGPTRAVLTSSVERLGCVTPYAVDPGSSVLDCAVEPARCAALCSAASPPDWCGH